MSIRSPKVEADLIRARALCELGRWSQAIDLLRQIVANDSNDPDAFCLLAQAHLGVKDAHGALAHARRAAALAPDDDWPHRLQSVAHVRMGEHGEAAAAAREALRLAPHAASNHIQAAQAFAKIKSLREEAAQSASRALALAPNEPASHIAAGSVAAACGDRAEAERAFRTALSLDPQNAIAHNELARLRIPSTGIGGARGLAAAAEGFSTAVRADPRLDVARHNVEAVLRSFLSRTAYFIFLDAWILGRVSAHSTSAASRVLTVALLVVPAWFAWQFLTRIPADVRAHLIRMPVIATRLKISTGLESVAIAALVAGAAAPAQTRPALAAFAAITALIGRLAIFREQAVATDKLYRRRITPMLGQAVLWTLAIALLATAIFLLIAPTTNHALEICLAIMCVAASAMSIRTIFKRRSR